MNVDSKNQDNQLYYVDMIIFRVTRVQKNPQKLPPQVEHEEQAEGGRGTRHPSGDGRLQPALKANVQKHISSKHYDIIGLQNPLEQARGRGGVVQSESVLAFQFISITRSLPPSSLCPD